MPNSALNRWFVSEVLPLEAALMRYLRRNWREASDMLDLRQEVYIRIYESAAKELPEQVKPFVFTTARNLLIDRARRAQIVPIEALADLESMEGVEGLVDELSPERHASGRGELRLLQRALEALPPRCRAVVSLKKVEGLSQREVAAQLGITEDTVERQMSIGIRALANALLVNGAELGAKTFRKSLARKRQPS